MKRHLADLIDKAADEFLWDGTGLYPLTGSVVYSCSSVWFADEAHEYRGYMAFTRLAHDVGMPMDRVSAFDDLPQGLERQGVRYAWLKLLAQYAREEGITYDDGVAE